MLDHFQIKLKFFYKMFIYFKIFEVCLGAKNNWTLLNNKNSTNNFSSEETLICWIVWNQLQLSLQDFNMLQNTIRNKKLSSSAKQNHKFFSVMLYGKLELLCGRICYGRFCRPKPAVITPKKEQFRKIFAAWKRTPWRQFRHNKANYKPNYNSGFHFFL